MAAAEQSSTTPARALPPEPNTIVVVIGASIAPADVQGLCERVRALLEGGGADPVICDVGALVGPDAGAVDALARLQLTARRLGRSIQLRHASRGVVELLALLGLGDVVPLE